MAIHTLTVSHLKADTRDLPGDWIIGTWATLTATDGTITITQRTPVTLAPRLGDTITVTIDGPQPTTEGTAGIGVRDPTTIHGLR